MATDESGRNSSGPFRLTEAFHTLSVQHQDALWATAVEGLSPTEVAERLGIAPIAVSVLAFRAAERLASAYVEAELAAETAEGCRAVLDQLPALARDALADGEARLVTAHVDGRRACQRRLAVLTDVGAALGGHVVEPQAPLVPMPGLAAAPAAALPPPPLPSPPAAAPMPVVPPGPGVPASRTAPPPAARRRRGTRSRWSAAALLLAVLAIAGVAAANLASSGGDAQLTADERATSTTRATTTSAQVAGVSIESSTTEPDGDATTSTRPRPSTTTTAGGATTTTRTTGTTAGTPTSGATTTTRAVTPTTRATTTSSSTTTTTSPPAPVADLGVDGAYSGGSIVLTVTNAGPDAIEDVSVILSSGITVSLDGCGDSGFSITCSRASVAAGESYTLTIEVTTLLGGTVQVSVEPLATDPDHGDNSLSVGIPLGG